LSCEQALRGRQPSATRGLEAGIFYAFAFDEVGDGCFGGGPDVAAAPGIAQEAAVQVRPTTGSGGDIVNYGQIHSPVVGRGGMVVSQSDPATRVGVDILRQGGNAVDAAVAVGYALAVTHPQAGNLGGGGFMMLRTKDGVTTAIDFREMAPSQATRDMFLDDQGNADSKKSLTSHLATGTPGTVAGFSLALDKYGTLPLNKVVQPAIKLARDGFEVNDALADDLKTYGSEVLPNHENSKAIFWKEGEPLKKGDKLVQANLAKSLEMIAENGPDAFYKGVIADQIVEEMSKNGGVINKADLA